MCRMPPAAAAWLDGGDYVVDTWLGVPLPRLWIEAAAEEAEKEPKGKSLGKRRRGVAFDIIRSLPVCWMDENRIGR